MLFTDEMKLNYRSALVNEIWQRCNQALHGSGEIATQAIKDESRPS